MTPPEENSSPPPTRAPDNGVPQAHDPLPGGKGADNRVPPLSAHEQLEALREENRLLREQLLLVRRRAETAMEISQERLRLIFENARDFAIFSMDLDRRITSWNPGAERILGFSEAEILGRPADLIFTPEDRRALIPESEQETALRKGRAPDERWHLRKDGSRLWGSGFMMAMNDADGKAVGLIKIFRDQTEARNTNEALRISREELAALSVENGEARRMADMANAAKDDFLAALSHELRTPLNPALMIIAALETDPSLPESARVRLTSARRNIELETRLIDDLLDVTRITRGLVTIEPGSCNLHELLERAVEIVVSDHAGARVELVFDYGAQDHWVTGEPSRLQQILWNLLKNAFKFTEPGGTITVRTSNPVSGGIEIAVMDTGAGISPEAQKRIFEPFEQGDRTGRHRFGGLGLGLAISKSLAVLHGGKLRVSSQGEGRGTTFTLELDTSPPPEASPPPQPEKEILNRPLRLLVVEDHQPTLETLAWLLRRDAHTVFAAASAREALAIADREACDVIISDIGLPDLSGMDLMREIKRLHGWPGIALSGYGMPEDITRSVDAGFATHLIKPIRISALRQALQDLKPAPPERENPRRPPPDGTDGE